MAKDGGFEGRDREVERPVHREVPWRRADHSAADPRIVKDASGTRWQVTEVSGRYVPGARGDPCFIFESDAAIRRVWHYPRHWRDLPAPDLIRVSWNR